MEFREMDKERVSLLGFGCMRFPTLANGEIDEQEAEKMLDLAIRSGVNYLDTAYPYHNGKSEGVMGKIAKKYDRSSLYYATKLPLWAVNSLEDADRIFEEQLSRLQTDYVDFYLFHAMDRGRFDKMLSIGLIEWGERKKAEGRIRHLGFSFHDSYEVFEDILKFREWDFCQIQFNYFDKDIQAGIKGYRLAESMGVPMIVMEPVKGGMLANMPEDIVEMFKGLDKNASVASWALRWVATFDNIKVVLSGMSTMEQVKDNLSIFGSFKPMNREELILVDRAVETIKSRVKNGCTGCRYCMPCPAGLDIPRTFRIWNDYGMFANKGRARRGYFEQTKPEQRADMCLACGACEEKCPQKLSIRDNMKQIVLDMSRIGEAD